MSQDERDDAFDAYAGSYEAALARGTWIAGEGRDYFAWRRIAWTAGRLGEEGVQPANALDFGCGTGDSCPVLMEKLRLQSVLGVDTSPRSIELARGKWENEHIGFALLSDLKAVDSYDLVYCNGVFHHIQPASRPETLSLVRRVLRPGGYFALWENNPWNPGTRYIMSRIPFDRDAVPLNRNTAVRLVLAAGFEVVRVDFILVFPRALRFLRFLEPSLCRWPIGSQYQVLCRNPASVG